jgi:EAL domain-containing protein (putative c-di-GMP-specific phosphodiesterase class I)
LPVNILKIDGSLVKFVATSDKHYRLLKSIVMMAKEFDLSIVAEFVEDEQIEKILGELHVDYSQGYFFSKPFDIREL